MKRFTFIGITAVVFLLLIAGQAYAESIEVKYSSKSSDANVGDYLYSEELTKKATFTIGRKDGFIIKELYWVNESGTKLRDAVGDWKGKESFAGTDTISGTEKMVQTADSHVYGGIYYWDRSGGTHLWRATGDGFVRNSNDPACPDPRVLDKWNYRMYPNCTDDLLSLTVTKVGPYYLDGRRENPVIPDSAIRLDTLRPVDVVVDKDLNIESIHKTWGKADDATTHYLGTYSALTKSSVRINFRQTFGQYAHNNGQYKDWANPGARQMWWYSAFRVNFQAMTYVYKDKQLIVEWEPKSADAVMTTVNVRHMARVGPTGGFVKVGESTTPLAYLPNQLPQSRTENAGTSYGKVLGRNVSYSGYTNTINPGTSITVTLNATTQKDAYVSFFYEVDPPRFTGDFDIVPSTINFRESFSFVPKNFVMNGCTYQSHRYRIERNGTFTTSPVMGQHITTSYSYSNYPWIIGVGNHTVSINIRTSCGETGWINPKTLTVNEMTGNRPPQFRIGFVQPQLPTLPIYEVVEGTVLNLIFIEDPSVPTPYDPDGDSLYFMGFDTENGTPFIRSLPQRFSEYTNGFHNVTMDALGYHYVSAQMRDQWGATATASTWINVVPKNPVAIAGCPTSVKSGREVPGHAFDSRKSYSPVGRTINHTRDEWTNKKTVYLNETPDNIFEAARLHVYDSTGLKSLEPGVCTFIVEPDLPPVARLEVPALGIRNQAVEIYNRSYSPDGDRIVSAEYRYKYDAANDGFANDEWRAISGGSLSLFSFTPSRVGKYLFYVKVTEDYGETADTMMTDEQLLTLDVINDAPTISFDLEGQNNQPELDPHEPYLADRILKDWKLYDVNASSLISWGKEAKWYSAGDTLIGGLGKLAGNQLYNAEYRENVQYYYSRAEPFQNNGLGPNNLSPYRAMRTFNSAFMQPLLVPENNGTLKALQFSGYSAYGARKMQIHSNPSHFYFTEPSRESGTSHMNMGMRFYAANKSKIGRYKGTSHTTNGYDLTYVHEWLEGRPYDFELGPHNIRTVGPVPKFDAYRYRSSQKKLEDAIYLGEREFTRSNILDYHVTDKTVYQFIAWQCGSQCSYYYDNGSSIYDSYTYYDIRAYDAFTGEFLSSTLDKQMFYKMNKRGTDITFFQVLGDNLLILSDGKIYEIDRKGEIIREKPNFARPRYTEPKPGTSYDRSCSVSHIDEAAEDFEAWYIREQTNCFDLQGSNHTYTKELHLIKVSKKDLTVVWRTKLNGLRFNMRGLYVHEVADPSNGYSTMMINPKKNELLVNTFDQDGFGARHYANRINTRTGARSTWNHETNGNFVSGLTGFEMDWNGNYTKLGADTRFPNLLTAEGWKTQYSIGRDVTIRDMAGTVRNSFRSQGTFRLSFMFSSVLDRGKLGTYIGDGMYISYSDTSYSNGHDFSPILHVGEPTTDPLLYDAFTLGQFVSDNKLPDAEIIYTMTMHMPSHDTDLAGMSFRMSNPRNRYAVENDGTNVYLSKYVNGVRTVLDQKPFISQKGVDYNYKLQFSGEKIKVYIDNVPYFEAEDSQFNDGYFGMFADKVLVDFAKIGSKPLQRQEAWSTQYAIWEEDEASATIRTDNVVFDDPEDDPIAELGWSLFHTPRFINNQGLSELHGQTITDGELTLDKVGDYSIALKGRDDPHPGYRMPSVVFDEYRKDSNEFVRTIIVHRRPIADFAVEQRTADGQVLWTDFSHDPDRYESAAHYSTEETGIDYRATKGILEKRFYYITPSGEYVAEKLVTPQEVGQYEIGLAVKDEYGAWSNWAVRMLDIGQIAVPNTPPIPGFTKSHTTTYRGVTVTIHSTARDAEDGGRENLAHTYYVRNKTANGPETVRSTSRTSWTTTFNELGTYTIRQLVEDSKGAHAQTQQDITIVNRKPIATVTAPASTNQNSPTKLTVLRPEFRWTYSDADSDKQQQFQVQIYRYGGYLVHDSQPVNGPAVAWTPSVDLPEKTNMYVQVRVHDGYEWGNWSTVRYFYIETNRPPTADFTWSPQPVYEGDTAAFRSIVSDPDNDVLSMVYELTSPAGVATTYRYTFTPSGSQYPATGPAVRLVQPGNWRMRLTASDGKASPVTAEKTIAVLPLAVNGEVKHTEQWNIRRQDYNRKASGNPESPRGYNVFWAGEKFVLEAAVTATRSATKAERVKASFDGIGMEVPLIAADGAGTRWQGELWDASFETGLKDGPYSFTFTAYYSNGTVKTDRVDIEMKGHVGQVVGVHRVK